MTALVLLILLERRFWKVAVLYSLFLPLLFLNVEEINQHISNLTRSGNNCFKNSFSVAN